MVKPVDSLPPSLKRPLNFWQFWGAFWKFSRPHTIIGTTCSLIGVYGVAIALFKAEITAENFLTQPSFLIQVFLTWLACICGNIYIVGLNQIEDVEIDQINKPHLPIASGEFSRNFALGLVAITGNLALVMAWFLSPYLLGMVGLSLAIGTAYSLPPIRLKRFPFWAAFCIFGVRGLVVNLGLYLHACFSLGQPLKLSAPILLLTVFILIFTVAIAIFKDIPDLEGDRQYNITTFTLKLGKKAVFNLSVGILGFCYLGMAIAGVLQPPQMNAFRLILIHTLAFIVLLWRMRSVDLEEKTSIAKSYQFIWKLFFLEYLLFPLTCL